MSSADLRQAAGLLVAMALGCLGACEDQPEFVTASFAAPSGMALAGDDFDRLFIANIAEDTLQVARLTDELAGVAFVRGDAIHFPLRIPTSPGPQVLAATPDGAYVLVLEPAAARLELVDANAERIAVDDAGDAVLLDLAPDAHPSDLVAAVQPCAAPCLGRFFVSLAGRGSVLAVEVQEGPAIVPVAEHVTGGAPTHLAAHPTLDLVFASIGEEVVRLDGTAGTVLDRLAVDAPAGPLAVSTDGAALVVTRPTARDLLVFDGAGGGAVSTIVVDPAFAPDPSCIPACGVPGSCTGGHPADLALCIDPAGDFGPGPASTYAGVYLDFIPSRLVALGVGAGELPLSMPCGEGRKEWSEFVAVAGVDGAVRMVGLRESPEAPVAPTIAAIDLCEPPTLESLTEEDVGGRALPPLDTYLASCPEVTAPAARLACTGGPDGGVVVFPGQTGSATWTLDWEGAIFSTESGGEFTTIDYGDVDPDPDNDPTISAVAFRDVNVAFGSLELRTVAKDGQGDLLDIVSDPEDSCAADLGDLRRCRSEREIIDVLGDTLILGQVGAGVPDTRVDSGFWLGQCYAAGGVVAYQLRVRDAYALRRARPNAASTLVARLEPGQRYGVGGVSGRNVSIILELDAQPQLAGAPISACERYTEVIEDDVLSFVAQPPLDPLLNSRDRPFGFVVSDPFRVPQAGLNLETEAADPLVAGRLPGDMIVTRLPGTATDVVWVTFTGTNTLVGFEPFDSDGFEDPDRVTIVD